MTEENKKLLLKDLCARLPYGVKVCYTTLSDSMPKVWDLIGMPAPHLADIIVKGKYRFAACDIEENIRPYLRPLSSMTEEEYETFPIPYSFDSLSTWNNTILSEVIEGTQVLIGIDEITEIIDWLNAHHFDYRGLIEKGLALEAPEEMYKID